MFGSSPRLTGIVSWLLGRTFVKFGDAITPEGSFGDIKPCSSIFC